LVVKEESKMLITPFKRVPSREIYGADISGLQAAVNRCEGVLSLGTAAVSGYVMTAVADQAEPSLHRYIYEADIRGWLEAPAPVVRRNGVIVSAVEYVLHAAQGAVVFHLQQATDALITADFTHVTGASALTGHPARTDNPHAVTAAQVGLGSVTNESKATMFASPALTAIPTAPTAAADTGTTQIATTAFVVNQASTVTPADNGVAAAGASLRYARADHIHRIDVTRAALAHGEHPTTDEKAALAGTSGTPNTANRYVTNSDARLSDARAPLAHNHAAAAITSGTLPVDRGGTGIASYTVGNFVRASGATALEQRTPTQVLADISAAPLSHTALTNNPHAVTAAQVGATPIAHESATAVHSATAAATADRIILRDAAGRAQVATPAVDADIARLDTVVSLMSRFVMDY